MGSRYDSLSLPRVSNAANGEDIHQRSFVCHFASLSTTDLHMPRVPPSQLWFSHLAFTQSLRACAHWALL